MYLVKVSISAKLLQQRALHISPDAQYRTRRCEGNREDCFETGDHEEKSLCSELLACSRSNTGVAAADKDAELDRAVQMQLHEDASAADGAHVPPRVFYLVHGRRPAVFFSLESVRFGHDLVELSALKAWLNQLQLLSHFRILKAL